MLIKAGVDISRLNREIRRALPIIKKVIHPYNEELVITSTYDGNHSAGSLHYCNDAVDIRCSSQKCLAEKESLKETLGLHYDVVLESDHIHIEYDPK